MNESNRARFSLSDQDIEDLAGGGIPNDLPARCKAFIAAVRADTQRSLEAPPDSSQGDSTASDSQRPEAAGPTISMVPLSLALDVAVEIVKDFAPQYEQEARQIANVAFAETQRSSSGARSDEPKQGEARGAPLGSEPARAIVTGSGAGAGEVDWIGPPLPINTLLFASPSAGIGEPGK